MSEKELETSPESRKLTPVVYAGWFAGFSLILVFHVVWEFLNDIPPVWDMAYHELMGWSFLAQLQQGESLLSVAFLTDYYPPLQYYIEALILRILGETDFFSLLSNLPGIVLLSFSTFRIAAMFLRPMTSVLVGWMVLLFPMVAWLSRVSLLDIPLAGWVAASLLSILFSEHFTKAKWVIVFGLCCVFGMLTKWTFVLFMVGPVFYTILDSSAKRRTLLNLAITAAGVLPMVLWWYWPNVGSLYGRFQVTAGQASWEQDPGIFSFWGWIYYPRSLSSYYLFLPLALVFLLACYHQIKSRRRNSILKFLIVTFLSTLILLTLLPTKDPRYVLPIVPTLAVLLLSPFDKRYRMLYGIFTVAVFQFLLCSFPTPFGNFKLAFFADEKDTDFTSVAREWVLISNNYFEIFGPARSENWRYQEIVEFLNQGDRVGFVPDSPFFNGGSLDLFATRRGITIQIRRLGNNPRDVERLADLDWIVGKTGPQGISVITQQNQRVYQRIKSLELPVYGIWKLPDGTDAILWRNGP